MRVATPTFRTRLRGEDGFTMLVTIGVLLVSGLLLTAAFTASGGDVQLSHHSTTYRQSYYAAAAGIQAFENELQKETNYWTKCPVLEGTVSSGASRASYKVEPLAAENQTGGHKYTRCNIEDPFVSMIEGTGSGAATDTFRIESTGESGMEASGEANSSQTRPAKQKIVATFKVAGFLDYVYFTRFEDEDPALYNAPSECGNKYYSERPSRGCTTIIFASGDSVNGPMHTDDAAAICGEVNFGRTGRTVPDAVEINGKPYAYECGGGSYKPIFHTASGESTVGAELLPPPSDESLATYAARGGVTIEGVTHLVLEGESIKVTNKGSTKTIKWPENGLIYVKNEGGCGYDFGEHYMNDTLDSSSEESEEASCGTVYVEGNYAKPLTVGAEEDVIIHNDILPSAISEPGEAPPSNDVATLGLIANDYVRVYHPREEKCKDEEIYNRYTKRNEKVIPEKIVCELTNKNGPSSLKSPWIYAAILATKSSFLVDNYNVGEQLGNLNVYGAIAQNYRGIVGQANSTGYLKEYIYDERLAVDEPPYFLQPLNAEWKVIRETSSNEG